MDKAVALPNEISLVKYPVRDRAEIKDFYDFSSNTYVRQISYERVIFEEEENKKKLNFIQLSQICISSAQEVVHRKNKPHKYCVLKDINRKGSSQHYSSSHLSRIFFCRKAFLLLFYVFTLSFLAFVVKHSVLYRQECHKHFDSNRAMEMLISKIHGQEPQIKQLLSVMSFHINSDYSEECVIVISGKSGVGKTYSVELITKWFPWENNVLYFKLSDYEIEKSDIEKSLSPCGFNLVILDNLGAKNIYSVLDLTNYLLNFAKQSKLKIIILLVITIHGQYNSHERLEYRELQNLIEKVIVQVDLIRFQELALESIKKCINDSLADRHITSNEIEKLILESLNPLFLHEGCKRIDKKVALFLEQNNFLEN